MASTASRNLGQSMQQRRVCVIGSPKASQKAFREAPVAALCFFKLRRNHCFRLVLREAGSPHFALHCLVGLKAQETARRRRCSHSSIRSFRLLRRLILSCCLAQTHTTYLSFQVVVCRWTGMFGLAGSTSVCDDHGLRMGICVHHYLQL